MCIASQYAPLSWLEKGLTRGTCSCPATEGVLKMPKLDLLHFSKVYDALRIRKVKETQIVKKGNKKHFCSLCEYETDRKDHMEDASQTS